MRESIRRNLQGTPDSQIEGMAEEIAAAFKRGKSGINFRNACPYWVGWWRDQKIYFCDDHDGVSKLALLIEEITGFSGFKVVEGLPGQGSYAIARQVRDILKK